ncbi:hypothetical protein [Methanosarcina barkeri]|uniref:hypothetical protein n=1 Tax=Methanosarcina barkeri TaxID=2208 RepID=UPI000AE8899E|nr:hypothetical protein [Methanosarcina barkeri]
MKADVYLMVTELGVEKTRPSDVKSEYVEKNCQSYKRSLSSTSQHYFKFLVQYQYPRLRIAINSSV